MKRMLSNNILFSVAEMVTSNRLDVLVICGTWLKADNDISLYMLRDLFPDNKRPARGGA